MEGEALPVEKSHLDCSKFREGSDRHELDSDFR